MRIELIPTDLDMLTTAYPRAKVTIEYPFDDLTMNQMLTELIKPALLASGFHIDTINKYITTEDCD